MVFDPSYAAQARGAADAYAAYYAGMDRSMQQKVALTTAYFPARGVLADMGCGSGAGSYDLACLHDGLHVIGVDVASESVAHARAKYQRANLEFRLGDIAEALFPPQSLDGVLNSSVFHHLTSFNDFKLSEVRRSLDNQTAALRDGGVLIIRDFVIPRGPDEVLLDLPDRDGKTTTDGSELEALSTSALFERFALDWRSSQNPTAPLRFRRLGTVRPGWVRYQLGLRAAAEFVLRKDYRTHFAAELREEYTYFGQRDFEQELRSRDLRVAISVELRNPWIIENRFRGRFFLYDLNEQPLPFPPTNYLIVGEKVRRGGGVSFSLSAVSKAADEPSFLKLKSFVHNETGKRFELVERPNPVIDLIPWFRHHGRLFVIGRQGFPRPLISAASDSPNLDGAHVAGYLVEPISATSADLDTGRETVRSLLAEHAGLPEARILSVAEPIRYFTSPGGLNERVAARLIELDAGDAATDAIAFLSAEAPNHTGFSSAGQVRPLVATQLLRAAQVGGLLDARLELSCYLLLTQLGEPLGPWIGAEISLRAQSAVGGLLSAADLPQLLSPPARAVFLPQGNSETQFLELRSVNIVEHAASGAAIAQSALEFVVPHLQSANTLSVLPIARCDDQIYIGLELRDLPAVQTFCNSSRFVTNPAWRLPRSIENLDQAEAWLAHKMRLHIGARLLRSFPLGGKYYPAAGATPEVVYPLAVEVDGDSIKDAALSFVPLRELFAARKYIEDGHLLIGVCRLWHALGSAEQPPAI